MSDALTDLLKARPDAVGYYFAFLKACSTRLDPNSAYTSSAAIDAYRPCTAGSPPLAAGCRPHPVQRDHGVRVVRHRGDAATGMPRR